MRHLAPFFSRLYIYATVCIVVGSPLFFIPRTVFSPDTTYYITMLILVAIALTSYVINAIATKSWHYISKIEFIAYSLFFISVIISSFAAHNTTYSLYGDSLAPFSGASLLSLPVIVYLVRSLPAVLRKKLKYLLMIILAVATFIFVTGLMIAGKISLVAAQVFSGFSSALSFTVYLGIFTLACLFFVLKSTVHIKYKSIIIITALIFTTWIVSLSSQDGARPDFSSTFNVGKNVLKNDGPFGVGQGNFSRAWQLYRPESVIASPYFGHEFPQGSDTMRTLFVTTGIFGFLSFLLLVVSLFYITYINYRRTEKNTTNHFILGFILLTLLYFACIAWVIPLSYSMLVVWMVVSGFGVSSMEFSHYSSSKKMAYLMIPITIILIMNAFFLIQKTQAFALHGKSKSLSSPSDSIAMLSKAISIYPFDGFYREQVEYAILANRQLVATAALSQEELQKKYLEKTSLAIEAARKAIKINSDNYQNYVSLGRAYELAIPFDKEAEYKNAKKAYEEAIKLYPENPYLYVTIARLEASAGTKEGVRVQLTEALKKKQNFADALYLMSQLEASNQKIDEAIAYALEAVKNAPNDPLTYIQAGLLFYGKKDYQNAVLALKTGLEKDPNNANIAYFLALSLRDGGRSDLAKPIAEELLRRNPDNSDLQAFVRSFQAPQAPVAPAKTSAKKNSTKK